MNKRIAYKTPTESFEARTVRQGACLIWTGAVKDTGYGAMWDGQRVVRPHRWIYEQTHGPIPARMDVDHICGNRTCCEISHLRATSRKQNMENLTRVNANSTSGIRGVHKAGDRWRVRVKHHYQEHYGGAFDTISEAEAAAIALRNKLFTHNNVDRKAA